MLQQGKNPRPAIVLLASSMAVLLIAGGAAALDVASDPEPKRVVTVEAAATPAPADDRADVAGEPDASTGVLPALASPTAGAVTPATVASPPSTQPEASGPTTRATTATPTTLGPRAPTSVVPPRPPVPGEAEEIGPGAWRSSSEGITATLRMSPVAPRVGQVVRFSIDVTYTGEGCCLVFLYPGHGAVFRPENNSTDCSRAPSSLRRELLHTYTRASMVTLNVQSSVFPCSFPPGPMPGPISSHLNTTIEIAPAA